MDARRQSCDTGTLGVASTASRRSRAGSHPHVKSMCIWSPILVRPMLRFPPTDRWSCDSRQDARPCRQPLKACPSPVQEACGQRRTLPHQLRSDASKPATDSQRKEEYRRLTYSPAPLEARREDVRRPFSSCSPPRWTRCRQDAPPLRRLPSAHRSHIQSLIDVTAAGTDASCLCQSLSRQRPFLRRDGEYV